ncbi:hypothetical protein [Mycobacterium sp. AZCC_0083]|uniref:hypothetical protein n=1 Tax=Mycobacterium sp. AZCC_0083 TaxID=2735882 RepID=UPI001607F80E|nr:hypothetical protein [Mycobacterium sp. AZCC_0083]MBB5160470.1 hypothetical protein [Mycobacterium sp. AZCC_0083]
MVTVVLSEQGKVITGWPDNSYGTAGERMDSRFSFLGTAHVELLNEILARRSPPLLERVRQADVISPSDAEEITTVISDEVIDNLDDDWEPTDYGQAVSAVLAQFNAARVNEWP